MAKKKIETKTISVRDVETMLWAKVIGRAAEEGMNLGSALNKIIKKHFKIK